MQHLQFSIDIDAPRERVWAVLWEDATYRDWTRAFSEGSYAVSDWQEGSTIRFLDSKSGSGMSAVIEKKTPNEFMSFRHVAEIRNGIEQPTDGSAAFESYTLRQSGGTTRLVVDLDAPDEYRDMFGAMFPKALQRVKALAETLPA